MSDRTAMQPAGLPGSRTAGLPKAPPKRPLSSVPATTTPAPARGSATPPAEKVSETAARSVQVSLSLPVELAQRLRERATTDRVSRGDVVLDAIETAGDRLHTLVEDYRLARTPATTTSSGRFVRRVRTDQAPLPLTSLSLRLDSRNLAAIDELAHPHGDRSRSLLCAAALQHYLTGEAS